MGRWYEFVGVIFWGSDSGHKVIASTDPPQRKSIEEREFIFALSGSSARKLKTEGVNLLAGRAARRMMFPPSPDELMEDFDLETVVRY